MRRLLPTPLFLVAMLVIALAAPSGALASTPGWTGWDHVRWIPMDIGPGSQCGVPFVSMHPTGYVDFWIGPVNAQGVQQEVQHWDGSMTFSGPQGTTVTMREDDWRHITRTYPSNDGSTYLERTTFTGLLEELTASDGARRLADTGSLTTRTHNVALAPGWYQITSLDTLKAAGSLPIRRSGFDIELQGWTRECAYFAAHLR